MSKVEISQEQADAIEYLLQEEDKETIIRKRATQFVVSGYYMKKERDIVYRKMTLDTLIKALYIGYEVEEEFKVGDWVRHKKREWVGEITKIVDGYQIYSYYCNDKHETWIGKMRLRLATPEEIAEEKQRRFWHSNNRDVWELKKGDILDNGSSEYLTVDKVNTTLMNEKKVIFKCDSSNLISRMKEYYTVVCFAHDRKDLKND